MSVEEARKAAQKIKGQIADGKNPYEEKNKIAKEPTFGEAFQTYLERYAKTEKKSWKDNEKKLIGFYDLGLAESFHR